MSENNPSDEINFEPFFNFIIRFLKWIGESATFIFSRIIKGYKKVIIGGLLGALSFIGLTFLIQPQFSINMTVSSSLLNKSFFQTEIAILEEVVKDENYTLLAKKLFISEEEAKLIHHIDVRNDSILLLIDDIGAGDKNFVINIDVYDTKIIENLEEGLLQYLENNPYALEQKKQKKITLLGLISKMEKNINEIDTLIKVVCKGMFPNPQQSGFIYGEPINPTTLIEQSDLAYSKLLRHRHDLQFVDNIHLVKGFTPMMKANFPKKSVFAVIGLITGSLLSILLLFAKKD